MSANETPEEIRKRIDADERARIMESLDAAKRRTLTDPDFARRVFQVITSTRRGQNPKLVVSRLARAQAKRDRKAAKRNAPARSSLD